MNVPRQPHQLFTTSIRLAALPSAVPCSRMFVRAVLGRWKLGDYVETAELAMSELATNAVRVTGFTEAEPKSWEITAQHVIGVQLRTLGTSLFLEVWDGSTHVPVTKNPDADAQGGRGMRIISMLAKQWDVYCPSVGGKVVWVELDLTQPAEPPSPYSAPLEVPVLRGTHPPRGEAEKTAHLALIERMLDGPDRQGEPRQA